MELAMAVESMFHRIIELASSRLIPSDLIETFSIALLVSLVVCSLNIITERWHGRYSFDVDINGIQKVHKNMVSRTGGIALLSGVLAVPVFGHFELSPIAAGEETKLIMLKFLLAATPAFLAGIIEDLTKKVSVRTRLSSVFVSAVLAAWLLGAHLPRLDVWMLDGVLGWLPVSIAVTAFAVVGVTNSINIVDGFHGVAGGTVVVVLAGAGFLAWSGGDVLVTQLALAGMGATIGFLLLNYPTGRLFMGDGGAYFLGFWAAEVAVLTIVRNPEINAWQILAIYAYPVIEVLFSMYRRKMLRSSLVGAPDRLHLHSLFYRRVACHRISAARYPWMRNAGVACFVTAWLVTATLTAILIGDSNAAAVVLVLVQILAYVAMYMRLVRGHWGRCHNPAVIFGLRPQYRSRAI